MRYRLVVATFVLAGLAACLTFAQDTADPTLARLKALREQLSQLEAELGTVSASSSSADVATQVSSLEARLAALERRVRTASPAVANGVQARPAVPAPPGTPAPQPPDRGIGVSSADGKLTVRLRGLVQSDGRFYVGGTDASAVDTFAMRRVRPIVEARLFDKFDLRLMPDFGDGKTVLQDAYVDLRFTPAVSVRGGKFKAPFGLERLVSASSLMFLERAMPTTVAPNRDVGVMVHGGVASGRVAYALGVFDGVPDGGSTDLDDRDSKDLTGRVFVHPFKGRGVARLEGFGVGVAFSSGRQTGTVTAPGLATYKTTGETYFRYRADGTAAGTAVADGARNRYSAQGYYYAGRLGLLAEQAFSSQRVRRGAAGADVGVGAWLVAGTWALTGERASYQGLTPRRSFEPGTGAWGALELAGRVTGLRVGDEAFPLFADPRSQARQALGWTAGLNWFLNRGVKVVLDYEQIRFDGGAADGDRATEHAVLSRFQFGF